MQSKYFLISDLAVFEINAGNKFPDTLPFKWEDKDIFTVLVYKKH